MTAYLQPGDRIHIAFPISRTKTGDALASEIDRTREYYEQAYGLLGVVVFMSDPEPLLTGAVVVAVFRNAAGLSPAQALDAECKALGLTPHPFRVNATGNCQVCCGGRYDQAHTGQA